MTLEELFEEAKSMGFPSVALHNPDAPCATWGIGDTEKHWRDLIEEGDWVYILQAAKGLLEEKNRRERVSAEQIAARHKFENFQFNNLPND